MNIVIGSDHRGFTHKEFIQQHAQLADLSIVWHDIGTYSTERTDYVEFAKLLCESMRSENRERGILICGSGVGMSVVANRYKGIYAGLFWNTSIATLATQDDHVNVVIIPSDFVTKEQTISILIAWLSVPFKRGRYQKRIDAIDALGGL